MAAKRIFITGGASGLGRALAERYARAGWRVCIGDVHPERSDEALAALTAAGATAHALRCDVTREEDLVAAADWLDAQWGGVDVVVNNAGVAIAGAIGDVPIADWQWAIDINLLGVVRGCRVFAPRLRRQGGGWIVNIASMAGLIHPPMMSAYCATKAAVVALSETLRLELADGGVGVTVVCPAFFRTHLSESLRASDPHVDRITRKLVDRAKVGAPEIAELVFRGVERGDAILLTHPSARLTWMIKRLTPFALYRAVMARSTRGLIRPRDRPRRPE